MNKEYDSNKDSSNNKDIRTSSSQSSNYQSSQNLYRQGYVKKKDVIAVKTNRIFHFIQNYIYCVIYTHQKRASITDALSLIK